MQKEVDDFHDSLGRVGSAVDDMQTKKAAAHKAIDDAAEALGKKVAADTAAPPVKK